MKYSYANLTEDQVKLYLERINYKGEAKATKDCLNAIVADHQNAIVFENTDIYFQSAPISLELNDLFDKLVTRKRGGFCFELNGLFIALLRSLGFDAWSCFCRVTMFDLEYYMPINHRGCIVNLDGQLHYCDVGFGGPMPGGALAIIEGVEQEINGETYWCEDCGDGWWEMWRKASDNSGKRILRFSTSIVDPIDFIALCDLKTKDDSEFRTGYMINSKKDDGYYAMSGKTLHISTATEEFTKEIENDEEGKKVLKEYFGITVE